MKKLTTLSAIMLFAFSISACDKTDSSKDFQSFQHWNDQQNQMQILATQHFQQQLQAAVQAKDSQAIQNAFQTYAEKIKETITSLDTLSIKDQEIKETTQKIRNYLTITHELMLDSAKQAAEPSAELQQAIADKSNKVQELMVIARDAQNKLSAKYLANAQADYQLFLDWNNQQNKFQEDAAKTFQQQIQRAHENNDKKAVQDAFLTYASKIEEGLKTLDTLKFTQTDTQNLIANIKAYMQVIRDIMLDSAKNAIEPSEELQQAIANKHNQAMQLMQKAQSMQQQLDAKFKPQ